MKKMLFALVVIFSLRALYATGYAAPRFDKMAFASNLPPGWSVVEIRKDTYPYGFLENAETLGLCISLGGQQQVLDKRTPVKESLVVWLMPVSYLEALAGNRGGPVAVGAIERGAG